MVSEFPRPVPSSSGRLFFFENEAEAYLRSLAGEPPVPDSGRRRLIPAGTFADMLGITRRTLGKRIYRAGYRWRSPFPCTPRGKAEAAE